MLVRDCKDDVAVVSAAAVKDLPGEGVLVLNARAVFVYPGMLTGEQARLFKLGVLSELEHGSGEELKSSGDVEADVDLPPRDGGAVDGDGVASVTSSGVVLPRYRSNENVSVSAMILPSSVICDGWFFVRFPAYADGGRNLNVNPLPAKQMHRWRRDHAHVDLFERRSRGIPHVPCVVPGLFRAALRPGIRRVAGRFEAVA